MKYIYDSIITKDDYYFEYLGKQYRRTGVNHMGEVVFYTFKLEGKDPLIVSPTFAVQFKEAAEIFDKIKMVSNPTAVMVRLKTVFEEPPEEMRFEAIEGFEYKYIVRYKDIEIYMDLIEGAFTLEPQFRIKLRSTLGYNTMVRVNDNPELAKYCLCD